MVMIFCSTLSSTVGGSADTGLYFIVFLVIIIILRMRRIINGTKISVARTIGFSAYYLIFGALILSGSFFLPIPFEYFVAYPILFAVTFLPGFRVCAPAGRFLEEPPMDQSIQREECQSTCST